MVAFSVFFEKVNRVTIFFKKKGVFVKNAFYLSHFFNERSFVCVVSAFFSFHAGDKKNPIVDFLI